MESSTPKSRRVIVGRQVNKVAELKVMRRASISVDEEFRRRFERPNRKIVEGKDPIPLIIAAIGMSLAAAMLGNIIEAASEGVTRPVTATIDYAARLKTFYDHEAEVTGKLLEGILASVFIDEAGDGAYVNIDDANIKAAFKRTMEATILASTLVTEDAGEIAMESIQEAFSNAVYYSLGGAVATWAAYRGGFMPPNDFFDDPGMQQLDGVTKANLDAMVGQNAYVTTAKHVLRLLNQVLESYTRSDKLDELLRLYAAAGDVHVHLLANAARVYDTIIDYLVEQARAKLNVIMRRAIDALDEASAAYADYKVGLVPEEQMKIVIEDVRLEMKELDAMIDDVVTMITEAIDELAPADDLTMANIASVIDKLETGFDDYAMAEFDELSDYMTTMRYARRRTKSTGLTWQIVSRKTGLSKTYTW